MFGKRILIGLAMAAMTTVGTAACSHSYEAPGQVVPENAVGLHVQNNNFLDMDVFAVGGGLSTRLGTVTGGSSGDFVINANQAATGLRIVATPIGGPGRATTGSLSVGTGETIYFTVGSVLANSSVSIR
jgi:hypothetical protein